MPLRKRHSQTRTPQAVSPARRAPRACATLSRPVLVYLVLLLAAPVHGETGSRQQSAKSAADSQAIINEATELIGRLQQIEDKLYYPAHTRLAVFLSVDKKAPAVPRSVRLDIDDSKVSSHVYTQMETSALGSGGIQRLYTGNIKMGNHVLRVRLDQVLKDGSVRTREYRYKFNKDDKARHIEIIVSGNQPHIAIASRD